MLIKNYCIQVCGWNIVRFLLLHRYKWCIFCEGKWWYSGHWIQLCWFHNFCVFGLTKFHIWDQMSSADKLLPEDWGSTCLRNMFRSVMSQKGRIFTSKLAIRENFAGFGESSDVSICPLCRSRPQHSSLIVRLRASKRFENCQSLKPDEIGLDRLGFRVLLRLFP